MLCGRQNKNNKKNNVYKGQRGSTELSGDFVDQLNQFL
jgi:hypothetical protein